MTTPRDATVLPPGLSAADFAAALSAFAGALGDGAVLRSAAEAGEFRDPYAFAAWDEHWPSAVLLPGSVEEVQEVVRIAGRYRVPLWTNSTGKNNAYYDNFTRGPLKAGDVVRVTSFVHYDLNSAGRFSAIRIGSYGQAVVSGQDPIGLT